MNRVCIRVDAYPEIGYGHLKRCLIIADNIRQRGENVFFVLAGDSAAAEEIQKEGFDLHQISVGISFSEQANAIDVCDFENVSITILDLSHSIAIKESQGLALYLKEISNKSFTVLIDSFGVQSLRENVPALICNILVSPYVGEQKSKQDIKYTELLGVDYFVLDTPYINSSKKKIREFANRVLITCGGSDPTSVSFKILNALNTSTKRTLDVKVVVGSGFSSELNQSLLKLSDTSPHNVSLIKNPNNLSAEMAWCDIAISTSGLTKYELAATGTPTILMSIDQSHDDVNQYFTISKTALDLGIADDISDTTLIDSMWVLLENDKERSRQSLAGQNLINGNGTQKLVNEILKYKNAH